MKHTIFSVLTVTALVASPVLAEDKPAAKPAASAPAAKAAPAPAAKAAPAASSADANMELSDAEAKSFWPIYESYQADLAKLNQRIGTAVDSYLGAYDKGAISNDLSKKLLTETLAIEKAELDLKRALATKLEKALPPYKVARYTQIENKVRAVIKYELAAQIPLVQ